MLLENLFAPLCMNRRMPLITELAEPIYAALLIQVLLGIYMLPERQTA